MSGNNSDLNLLYLTHKPADDYAVIPPVPRQNQPNSQNLTQRLNRSGLMVGLQTQAETLQVALLGKLDARSSGLFKEFMSHVLKQEFLGLEIDLAGLNLLDDAGTAALVWLYRELADRQGDRVRLNLSGLSKSIRRTLIAANFHYLVNLSDYEYC